MISSVSPFQDLQYASVEAHQTSSTHELDPMGGPIEPIIEPQQGQSFSTIEDFEKQLHHYSAFKGFTFSVKSSSRSPDGQVITKQYICSRGGHYRRHTTKGSRPNTHTIKCGCPVAVNIGWRRRRGMYVVGKAHLGHNHPLDGHVLKIPTQEAARPQKVIAKELPPVALPYRLCAPGAELAFAETAIKEIVAVAEAATDATRQRISHLLSKAATGVALRILPEHAFEAPSPDALQVVRIGALPGADVE
eukprot:gnl/Chilomastix_cuspidata/3500.p1 GENE.gnl/Chilomastix_cuspidata/3500~~gnl/Chilomastix_cuspidata/3500.p1  ORF type:complete len:248 (+),score=85.23 gnl/Chilomastix_cuspidata/3500:60-803(+)